MLLLYGLTAYAESGTGHWTDEVSIHGFLSQGYANTDKNNFLGSSKNGSFDFNEAGINASWSPANTVLLSAQLLYKRTGNAKPKGTQLDYAIADWRIVDSFDYGLGIRGGRLKNPYGFFNETRDVPATRPGILLPEGIYLEYLRELIHSSDSVAGYAHRDLGHGIVSFDALFGQPIINDNTVRSLLGGAPTNGSVDNERIGVARLGYENANGNWRLAVSHSLFRGDFKPAPGEQPAFQEGDILIDQTMLSVEFNWQKLHFVSEYQWRDIEYQGIFFGTDTLNEGIGFYGQLGYHISPEWYAYLRKEEVYLNKDDKDGVNHAISTGRPAHSAFAKNIVYGLRFQPTFEWTFGMEFHRVNGTVWLPDLENPNIAGQKQYWDMILLQAAYRF